MRKSLHFNSDGKFKIVQFTDTEFSRASEEETRMKAMMAKILEAEKPDLAVYTGDVIASPFLPSAFPYSSSRIQRRLGFFRMLRAEARQILLRAVDQYRLFCSHGGDGRYIGDVRGT